MQRCSLYRVHKVHGRKDGRTDGITAALLYPHRNALLGDNKGIILKVLSQLTYLIVRNISSGYEAMNKVFESRSNLKIEVSALITRVEKDSELQQ